ncbi:MULTISPECIES: hypothetical protein [Saliphagus]|uniref:Uncharacterized protein n=1 Tax=Saliphagus infecundisoli TaxID=1849069 RepID=A0ABD5QGK4_9EURY|nr:MULTISPECIES: hypothetical protein [Saliphagus]
MDVPARRREDADATDDGPAPVESIVSSHETRPGKVVLTERNNSDGWISSTVAVDLEP